MRSAVPIHLVLPVRAALGLCPPVAQRGLHDLRLSDGCSRSPYPHQWLHVVLRYEQPLYAPYGSLKTFS